GGDPLLGLAPVLEHGGDAALADEQREMPIEPDEPPELLAHALLLAELDEQRRREVALAGQELVVDCELLADRVEIRHALDPEHLLRLVPDRRPILEEQAQPVADRHAARPLVGNHTPPDRLAGFAVSLAADDVVETDRPHQSLGWRRGPCPASALPRRSATERLETLRETTGMGFLGLRQRLEPLGDLLEPLVARRLGEARVHLRELVRLASDRGLEVLVRRADRLARRRVADLLQEVEVPERVPRLGLGGIAEEPADVGVALDVGAACKVQIAAVRLRLAGERFLQVAVRLRVLQRLGHASSRPDATEPGPVRRACLPDRRVE